VPVSNDQARLHAAMAGSGDPYAVVTVERLPLLRALLDHSSLPDLASAVGMPVAEVRAVLDDLVPYGLVGRDGDAFCPRFFIATSNDVELADAHARIVGRDLADLLMQDWDSVERSYRRLTISAGQDLHEHGFFLVGGRMLDISLLDALAADGTLMPLAPERPGPGDPGARYYFWLIEGEWHHLGRYGQRTTLLPIAEWDLLTFGEYRMGNGPNAARDALEAQVREVSNAVGDDPYALGAMAGIPVAGAEDVLVWKEITRWLAQGLLAVYLEYEPDLRMLHASLEGGQAQPDSFAEFFCWYDHLAYSHAIDTLADVHLIDIPQERFTGMLWHVASEHGAS
jgi:hypothetical protein